MVQLIWRKKSFLRPWSALPYVYCCTLLTTVRHSPPPTPPYVTVAAAAAAAAVAAATAAYSLAFARIAAPFVVDMVEYNKAVALMTGKYSYLFYNAQQE